MSYQADVDQMKGAGFSGPEIQNWSDGQAVQMKQAGFGQDEIDGYQGMKAPAPGTPQIYGRLPTDDDFKNAATVVLKGNDHPFYEKAVDTLKGLFSDTGIEPAQAVKAAQNIPSFQQIMEHGGEGPQGSYLQTAGRDAASAISTQMKGLADIQAFSKADKPLFDIEPGKDPEQYWLYQKGAALQKWIDDKIPAQPAFEAANPIKTGLVGGLAQLPELVATGGLGMGASGAQSAYQEARQSGAEPPKAAEIAGKSGMLWGVLGIADVGTFLKPIERAAPGFLPWITTKALQAVRGGVTFATTNEFGDWATKEIGQAADVPMQYKPTLQRMVVNALTGMVAGATGKAPAKEGVEAPVAAEKAPAATPEAPTQTAEAPTGPTAAYHFDTDSYGVKNEKGEFTQTGFATEEEAQKAAEPTKVEPAQETAAKQDTGRLPPEVVDRYRRPLMEEAQKMGLPLTPEQIENGVRIAAQKMAEEHNPEPVAREENPYVKVPPRPLTLSEYLAKNGGLKDDTGDLASMDADKAHINPATGKPKPFAPKLVREDGMSLDDAALKAQEAGFFPELQGQRPSVDQFVQKLGEDLRGNAQHSELDADRVAAHQEAKNRNNEIDQISHETGIETKGKTHAQFFDEVAKHYSPEQQKTLESAASESWRLESVEPEELTGHSPEELEHEWQQDQNAKNIQPIETGPPGPEPAPGPEGRGEEGVRPIEHGAEPAGRPNEAASERGGGITEPTGQSVIPGAERISDRQLAERQMEGKSQPTKEQRAMDEGLFDVASRGQHEMFQKGEALSPEASKLLEPVTEFLKRVAPRTTLDVKADAIHTPEGEVAHGSYDRLKDLITLSLTSPDQLNTAAHEALHAVRDLIAPEEWQKLVDEGNKKGFMDKYEIAERYKDNHDEEMVAHWFADWAKDKADTSTESKTLFEKIKDILTGLAQKVRDVFGAGSADDIFRKIESGEVGQREPSGEKGEGTLFQKDKEKPTLGDALRGIRNTFSPTSAGEKAKTTEVSLRGSYGEAKRERSIAEAALSEFARQANEMTPKEHEDFYNYVEGRSSGVELKNKQFQRMADTVREVYGRFKDLLQSMPETRMMNFVTDYFTHQWAKGQDDQIKEFMNSWWQQGSSRNLKERKIPTIADGLAYGLKLEEPNPVRAVSRYAGSMSNYIASVNVLRDITQNLGGAYYADGKQPGDFAPLVGRNAERIENARIDPESGKIIPARNLHLYAPKEVADLYNAFYSKGFEDTKLGSAYMLARNAINANTMLELGLSAYHFSTISIQSINQDVSRILRNALAGDWQGVGQAVQGLATPAFHFREGQKLTEQYNNLKDHGIDMEEMADHFAKSNLRLGLDPLSNVSTHGGFYKAWQRGELPSLIEKLKGQVTEGYGTGALKTGAEVVGRVVSDISHPLFNVYVPTIKISAFHDLMGDWLRQNPGASDGEIGAARVRIGDLVEDRFGELNMENLFWNKKAKELLGLSLRAPGWDLGLVRQVGGAGVDFFHLLKSGLQGGKGFDPARLDRPLFMIGAALTYAAMNSAATYIKTGKKPSDDDLKDLIAYATGGTHKAFGEHPERAELPGHGRELIQLAPTPGKGPMSGVTQEVGNKVASLPKNMWQALNNEDWKGKPLYDPKSKNWVQRTPVLPNALHVLGGFKPFSMEQLFEPPEGTHLSFAERFLGVRPAGAKVVNPKGLEEFNRQKGR